MSVKEDMHMMSRALYFPNLTPVVLMPQLREACVKVLKYDGETLGDKIDACSIEMIPKHDHLYDEMEFLETFINSYVNLYGFGDKFNMRSVAKNGWAEMFKEVMDMNLPIILYNHMAGLINKQGEEFWDIAQAKGLSYDDVILHLLDISNHVDSDMPLEMYEKMIDIEAIAKDVCPEDVIETVDDIEV